MGRPTNDLYEMFRTFSPPFKAEKFEFFVDEVGTGICELNKCVWPLPPRLHPGGHREIGLLSSTSPRISMTNIIPQTEWADLSSVMIIDVKKKNYRWSNLTGNSPNMRKIDSCPMILDMFSFSSDCMLCFFLSHLKLMIMSLLFSC